MGITKDFLNKSTVINFLNKKGTEKLGFKDIKKWLITRICGHELDFDMNKAKL